MHQPHRLIITITIPLVAFMISLSQGIENTNPEDLNKLFSDLGNESYEIRQNKLLLLFLKLTCQYKIILLKKDKD